MTPLKHLIRSVIMIALSTYLAISTVYHDQNYRLSVIKKIYKKNLQQILYFLKKSLHKATLEKPLLALPYTIKIFFFYILQNISLPLLFCFVLKSLLSNQFSIYMQLVLKLIFSSNFSKKKKCFSFILT